MNITFNTVSDQKVAQNMNTSGMEFQRPSYNKIGSYAIDGSATCQVDLESSLFGNEAYTKKTRSLEDLSQMAQNTDVLTQHNYMALLSNTMSAEDFARASKDGFDLRETDPSETVTIVDKIKSVLLESGVEITGYNDDLSLEKLTRITGSEAFASAIQKSFHDNDVPVTSENVKAAKVAYDEIKDMTELSDSAVKFMVLNKMEPTIENLYFAAHSTNGMDRTARGFYVQEMGGYYAQKSEEYDWQQLAPQIDRIIEEAGLDASKEDVKDTAKWIVEQGIPLTPENLTAADKLRHLEFPVTEETAADAIAAAKADYKKVTSADICDRESFFTKAKNLQRVTRQITPEGIKRAIAYGKEINIKNLDQETRAYQSGDTTATAVDDQDPRFIKARLQLEEVRMKMTVEANRQLLSSGFSIDTAPMQDLIDHLKSILGNMSDETAGIALDEITGVDKKVQSQVMTLTISRVNVIKTGPIDVTGAMGDDLESATLSEISTVSQRLTLSYTKARKSYEPLSTQVRSDLGDSIKKAFGNVDELLKENGEEVNEDNRRAVRILGYNSMEITKDNIEKIKSWDQTLKATLDRLKPGAVLDLIRDGKNPLSMTLEELGQALDQNLSKDGGNKGNSGGDEKYSRFIYKLEKQKNITQEEKTSFIGIYRLFSTIKAGDYQAIGAVLKTGRDMTLENLLSATRTQRTARRGLDFTVDDSFGGLEAAGTDGAKKIDEQINLAFRYYSAKADIVYENLEPEKLSQVKPNAQTLLNDLADRLENAYEDRELDNEFYRQQVNEIRNIASSKAAAGAVDELNVLGLDVTLSNIEAMISNRRDRRSGSIWDKTEDLGKDEVTREQSLLAEALGDDDYGETYRSTLSSISDKLTEVLEQTEDSYIDVKSIKLMQKQLTVMSQSSERGSFDVPAEIDGQKISMHITLRSDDTQKSRMEASVQTYEYGLITATLYEEGGMIAGMLTTTNSPGSEETEYLETVRRKMCDKLAEKIREFGVGQDKIAILYHAQIQPVNSGAASANATDGNLKNITETGTLLKMAKAFLEAL
ncbi:DUF6240 domain-containing protein [Butyrivibrio sp. MC2021]|uniref:DUF6240 domain-containing protein n=1 Tax=Butyrivibrio sp. MC2021 TaxID=1408306 RepID=UPI00047AF48B|nr:DUF6240 domain-containing protein [Butyrivibrio sp. MC2021]